jgi:hypothetical protein
MIRLIIAIIAAAALSAVAVAQTIDRAKPALAPASLTGAYADPLQPSRFCLAESGLWGSVHQTLLVCSPGGPVLGLAYIAPAPASGQNYLLYRPQSAAGQSSWVVETSVTITSIQPGEIRVRFGTPGAQTPEYRLIRIN